MNLKNAVEINTEMQSAAPRLSNPNQRSKFGGLTWVAILLALNVITTVSAEPKSPKVGAVPLPVETRTTKPAWERIVMVGASASAGFTESEPFGGPRTPQYSLSRYVDAVLLVPHEPVKNFASTLFFMQPAQEGRRQLDEAIKTKPTVVLAVDFLFWFSYGPSPTDAKRLERFEQGLKLLEEVRCPLVLGDIPDASAAANGMLPPEWMPSAATLAANNKRLREWAATRKQAVVISLSSFMRAALANQPFKIQGQILASGKTSDLLQSDKLHPTPRGCAALALVTIDALQSAQPDLFTRQLFRWNLNEVWRIGSGPSQSTSGTLKKN